MKFILAIPLLILTICFKIIALPFQLIQYMFMNPEQRQELRDRRELEELENRFK